MWFNIFFIKTLSTTLERVIREKKIENLLLQCFKDKNTKPILMKFAWDQSVSTSFHIKKDVWIRFINQLMNDGVLSWQT